MPGPANHKGKKKRQAKKNKAKGSAGNVLEQKLAEIRGSVAPSRPSTAAARIKTPLISRPPTVSAPIVEEERRGRSRTRAFPREEETIHEEGEGGTYFLYNGEYYEKIPPEEIALYEGMEAEVVQYEGEQVEQEEEYEGPEEPYIYDPGNGPRVRDFVAFLHSPFAVQPSVEFVRVGEPKGGAEDDVDWTDNELVGLLARAVPDELALVLWYNRTRATHRICPTCQRVYHVGEALRPHLPGVDSEEEQSVTEEEVKRHAARTAEQWLSGICSIPCFALSTYTLGPAAVLAYGLWWSQLDEGTKVALQPGEDEEERIDDQGLSAYVALSRCTGREMLVVLTREDG
ncbi:SubName: Full=Uncharacterized protein {ECO:0000313/EMBL:CCA71860.1} [Serendipita indica DSM 11827]|uniref:Uncharacterized protein n=1 Tax=Serendipita indica (strain DSM 11827) TaxID=1109443 RepID=G4TKL3_SERID|nr:SubName: Full=Uncharacterized protein {ECO:0000313/EMBL:CCA71860.1} [Serendipita indica DSM 11827]CCA71860.1 hypothetical protein PIIN_05795 [Serendipita indica DSM 11827]